MNYYVVGNGSYNVASVYTVLSIHEAIPSTMMSDFTRSHPFLLQAAGPAEAGSNQEEVPAADTRRISNTAMYDSGVVKRL